MSDLDEDKIQAAGELAEAHVITLKLMDSIRIPLKKRKIELSKKEWPDQYRLGIKTVLGIEIIWID